MNYAYDGEVFKINLVDDGTLDTVVRVNDREFRFIEDERNTDGSLSENTIVDAIEAYLEVNG